MFGLFLFGLFGLFGLFACCSVGRAQITQQIPTLDGSVTKGIFGTIMIGVQV